MNFALHSLNLIDIQLIGFNQALCFSVFAFLREGALPRIMNFRPELQLLLQLYFI